MKVRDLVEYLKTFDQELDVVGEYDGEFYVAEDLKSVCGTVILEQRETTYGKGEHSHKWFAQIFDESKGKKYFVV